jgi:predicted PurR-regulated permease PerM
VGIASRIRSRAAALRERLPLPTLETVPSTPVAPAPAPRPAIAPAPASASASVPTPGPDPEVEIATTTTPEFDRAVPRGLQIAAAWAWRVILVAALIYGLMWLAGHLSEVVVPIAIAILLAAMLSPVANRLHSWGLPRAGATAITVFGGLLLMAGALTLIGTQIASQASTLSTNVVEGYNQLIQYLQNGPLHISASVFDTSEWGTRFAAFLKDSQSTVTTYAGEIGAQVGHFVAGFFITLFSLFYFLYEGRKIFTFLLKFFPHQSRAKVDEAALKGWVSLSHYVRATILVALTDAAGVFLWALVLGVPVAPALGALVFIGAFVPLVGAFLSGSVAVLVAFVALGWFKALIMFVGIILVVQVEGHLLQPLLLGRAVKLHPLAVLLAIAIGIIGGGVVGALVAVPILAFTKSFIQYLAGEADQPLTRIRWPSGQRRR